MLGSLLALHAPRRATALIASFLVVMCGELAVAQTVAPRPLPPGEPARFLQKYIGLSPAEIEQARKGEVVTKLLDAADREEVALFGIEAVDAPRDDVVRRVRDLPNFLRTPGRSAFGLFATPATPSDASAFTVEDGDFDAIKGCKPGECNVKMPTANIEEFRSKIDWSSPSAKAQVENMVRLRAATYVNNYRRAGTAAMVAYGDEKESRSTSDVFNKLLAQSPYLFDYIPALHKYLVAYPAGTLPDVTDAIYWATDKMGSMRPIMSINHVSVYSPPGSPLTLLSSKQLYASHYFLGAFTLTTILDRPESPNGKGVYYIVVQRLRFDHLPGGLLNIRGRVIGRVHDGLKAELAQKKTSLEGR
jgi:hypothetical protein